VAFLTPSLISSKPRLSDDVEDAARTATELRLAAAAGLKGTVLLAATTRLPASCWVRIWSAMLLSVRRGGGQK
jgi:hypothetical protein